MAAGGQVLTALIPTRNRPDYLDGQLRLFAATRAPYPVAVIDSSDPDAAAAIRDLCRGRALYCDYTASATLYDKLTHALDAVETPLTLVVADRKITFPHAVEAAVDCLAERADIIAAQGYVLDFAPDESGVEIRGVRFYVPGLDDDDPLQRYYHLMQRYQPGHFAVFRTAPLRLAASLAAAAAGAVFQEVIFMAALALLGKTARLANIFTLQAPETSFNPLRRNDPAYWLMHEPASFVAHYLGYRDLLLGFMAEHGIAARSGVDTAHLIDVIHAMWLHRNLDQGELNHAVRALLDSEQPPLPERRASPPMRPIGDGDEVHARAEGRRHLWRRAVLNPEPAAEIRISGAEIARVDAALDLYFGDQAGAGGSAARM